MKIYTITNQINKKQYVGKTKDTVAQRFREHIRSAKEGSDCAIHRAIRKYGRDAFIVEEVDMAVNDEELKQKERDWIAKLDTFGESGYNMTPGGDGEGHKHSPETIEKLRQRKLEYFENNPEAKQKAAEWAKLAVFTDEMKKNLRQRMLGNTNMKGKPSYVRTEAHKAAVSRAQKEKIVSEETRLKISQRKNRAFGNRNAMADPANRAKVAASKIGRKKMYREDGTAYMGYPPSINL